MTHTGQRPWPRQDAGPRAAPLLQHVRRGVHGVAAGGRRHSARTAHQLDFCIDHLAAAPSERTTVARTLTDVRAEMDAADEPGQWAYDHLWARRLGQVITPSPTPITTIPFLVRPWLGQWRWATSPGPTSLMAHLGTDTFIEDVVDLLRDSDRLALLTLVASAQPDVGECHLDLDDQVQAGRAPAVVMARRLGAAENPLVIGVWIQVDARRDGDGATPSSAH